MTGDGSTRLEGGRKWWNRLKVEGDEQIGEGEVGNSLKKRKKKMGNQTSGARSLAEGAGFVPVRGAVWPVEGEEKNKKG